MGFTSGIVAINQLSETPETLWLRLLGQRKIRQQAIDELMALPASVGWVEWNETHRNRSIILTTTLLWRKRTRQLAPAKDSSIGFTYGYSCFTPSGLEIWEDEETPSVLNVNSHRFHLWNITKAPNYRSFFDRFNIRGFHFFSWKNGNLESSLQPTTIKLSIGLQTFRFGSVWYLSLIIQSLTVWIPIKFLNLMALSLQPRPKRPLIYRPNQKISA